MGSNTPVRHCQLRCRSWPPASSGLNTEDTHRVSFKSVANVYFCSTYLRASGCAVTRFNVSDSRCCETCTAVECDPSNNGTRSGICKNDREELTACQISAGCDVPRELRKVTLPDYLIEIPDILLCAVPEAAESGRDSEIRAVYKITWTALARGMQHTKTKGPATRPEISVARCSHIPT